MEVGRQITLWFIVCFCANMIYTEVTELADNASTTPPSEVSSSRSELETGNLSGTITAYKNGTKLNLKINSKVFWENNKNKDGITSTVPAVEKKGQQGDKGETGTPGKVGEKGQQGDKGETGTPGKVGEKGQQGDKGETGTPGKVGEKGQQGDKGETGTPGKVGEKGQQGDKGETGTPGKVGEKGQQGDKGETGTPGKVGEKGQQGDKGETGTPGKVGEKGEKGDRGETGTPGKVGEKGEKGDKGETGTPGKVGKKGDPGKCIDSCGDKTSANYGQLTNPAYSCSDISENGIYFINKENSIKVQCKNYTTSILDYPINRQFNDLEKDKPVWLSSKNLNLTDFYLITIPDLSYLMATNVGFALTLTHSDEVEILKILSWNGISNSIPLSNLCQSYTKKIDKQTTLEIKCSPPYYLPMDFYIKATNEKVSIKLKSLCFT